MRRLLSSRALGNRLRRSPARSLPTSIPEIRDARPTVKLPVNFTPTINSAAGRISEIYQWPGHYLKFERPGGEINFLSPPLQTSPGFAWKDILGRRIAIETPEEVIIKKIRYRSEKFTARDAFDLAAVAQARPGLATIIAEETSDAIPRVKESLRILIAKGKDLFRESIVPSSFGRSLIDDAYEMARQEIEKASTISENDGLSLSQLAGFAKSKGAGIGD